MAAFNRKSGDLVQRVAEETHAQRALCTRRVRAEKKVGTLLKGRALACASKGRNHTHGSSQAADRPVTDLKWHR